MSRTPAPDELLERLDPETVESFVRSMAVWVHARREREERLRRLRRLREERR